MRGRIAPHGFIAMNCGDQAIMVKASEISAYGIHDDGGRFVMVAGQKMRVDHSLDQLHCLVGEGVGMSPAALEIMALDLATLRRHGP